jgi:hypothetical protein
MNSTYVEKYYTLVFFCPRDVVMVDTNEGVVDVVLEEITIDNDAMVNCSFS